MTAVEHVRTFEGLSGLFPHTFKGQASTEGIFAVLYAMVRLGRPNRVVELGTHHGQSSAWMVRALVENGTGSFVGIDNDPGALRIARDLVGRLMPDATCYEFIEGDLDAVERGWHGEPADFVFVDSEPKQRYAQHLATVELAPGCTIAMHDSQFMDLGQYVQAARRAIESEGFQTVEFPQERGLVVARRNQ